MVALIADVIEQQKQDSFTSSSCYGATCSSSFNSQDW
jgi:hypothetical protein